jgi:hypothetical protein
LIAGRWLPGYERRPLVGHQHPHACPPSQLGVCVEATDTRHSRVRCTQPHVASFRFRSPSFVWVRYYWCNELGKLGPTVDLQSMLSHSLTMSWRRDAWRAQLARRAPGDTRVCAERSRRSDNIGLAPQRKGESALYRTVACSWPHSRLCSWCGQVEPVRALPDAGRAPAPRPRDGGRPEREGRIAVDRAPDEGT